MKKTTNKSSGDELRKEYGAEHFRSGVRGKYLERYRAGTNLVLLEPDVAAVFATERAVNDVLRMLITVARKADSRT